MHFIVISPGAVWVVWENCGETAESAAKVASNLRVHSFNRTESLKPLLSTMPVFFNLLYPYSENMIHAASNLRYWKVENLDVDNFTHVPSACTT